MSEETGQEGEGQEPSMEDILASIRRILAEDGEEEGGDEAGAAPPAPEPAPAPAEEEMDMAAAMEEAAPQPAPAEEEMDMAAAMEEAAPEPAPAEEEMDMAAAMEAPEPEPAPEPAPAPAPAPESALPAPPPPAPAPAEDVLELTEAMALPLPPAAGTGNVVSSPTARASTDVLAELARSILRQRDIAVGGRDVTLEGLIREMLRPLLREWLDDNLPYLIERLVKKEIDVMINRAEGLEE